MLRYILIASAVLLFAACGTKVALLSPQATIALPGGAGGIGFDDMSYAGALGRLIVPAGQTGDLDLIDPATGKVTVIAGVTATSGTAKGRGRGATSAAYGLGYFFAGDRTNRALVVIDAGSKTVLTRHGLASVPDYVRYAASQKEIWVTEPKAAQIEIFRVHPGARPLLTKRTTIAVPGGPESLVIDDQRDMAYTNLWSGKTVAVDLLQERVIERWDNGCKGSRGLALAPARGLLFVGCREGRVVSLDVAHGGETIASSPTGRGVDIIAYNRESNRLYVPAADSRMLTVLSIAPSGHLRVVAKYHTAADAHCVVSDDSGRAYVCDPSHGRLLVVGHGPPAG